MHRKKPRSSEAPGFSGWDTIWGLSINIFEASQIFWCTVAAENYLLALHRWWWLPDRTPAGKTVAKLLRFICYKLPRKLSMRNNAPSLKLHCRPMQKHLELFVCFLSILRHIPHLIQKLLLLQMMLVFLFPLIFSNSRWVKHEIPYCNVQLYHDFTGLEPSIELNLLFLGWGRFIF